MARKGWASLSAGYRSRLEKAGISQQDYDAGAAIQKARGHGNTPENPRDYDPKKYQKYHSERTRLEAKLEARKQQLFGQSDRWDSRQSKENVRMYPPSLKDLRVLDDMDDDELMERVSEIDSTKEYAWLGYH